MKPHSLSGKWFPSTCESTLNVNYPISKRQFFNFTLYEQKRALSPTFVCSYPFKIYISNEQLLYQFLVRAGVILPKNQPPSYFWVSLGIWEETGTLALSPEALLVKCPWKSHETTV